MTSSGVCVVVGVGPGNGAALSARFASGGYRVAMLARDAGKLAAYGVPGARAYACDVGDPAAVREVFARVASELGPVDVVAYNAGSGVWGAFDEVDPAAFEASFRVNVLGLVHVAREVVPSMRARGGGAIAVIGASAAWRGRAKTAVFAQAKAAQRSLAQSLARQLGPERIHVGYVVIDAVVDLPSTRQAMPGKADTFFARPGDIAEAVWGLVHQPPSAWTFELDLRPFGETW